MGLEAGALAEWRGHVGVYPPYLLAPETLARFERGERKPSLPVVLRVAAAFGVSVEELAGVAVPTDEKPLVSESRRILNRLDDKRLKLAARLLKVIERAEL